MRLRGAVSHSRASTGLISAYTRETDERIKVLGFAGWKAQEPKAGVFEV
jgi:hypothetical protein